MRSIGAFCISTWLAAVVLFLGRHSVPLMAVSGVIVFAGLDLFRPGSDDQ
jgi:MFS superfamily sulfate permease-like transporter